MSKEAKIVVLLTQKQKEIIEKKAAACNNSASGYLAYCGLNGVVDLSILKIQTLTEELDIIERHEKIGRLSEDEAKRVVAATIRYYERINGENNER